MRLLVAKAGTCACAVRRFPQKSALSERSEDIPGLTVGERRRILEAADSQLVDQIKPTPTAVLQRMGPPAVNGDHLRAVLHWSKQVCGNSAVEFRQSEEEFTECTEKWKDLAGIRLHLDRWTLRVFSWVAGLTPFLLELARLHERGSVRDLDWTLSTSTISRRSTCDSFV